VSTTPVQWHPENFSDFSERLRRDPVGASHALDFTLQALSTRTSGNTTEITNITQVLGGKGTVTSVALAMPSVFAVAGSPITTAGTFNVSLASQAQNLVWASPNGSAGPPTFRALVAGDIPALAYVPNTRTLSTTAPLTIDGGASADLSANRTLAVANATSSTKGVVQPDNTTITISAGVISAVGGGGSGTVTSVDMTVPTGFTISGNPVTTSGTLAIGLSNENANLVWAGPTTGSPAPPTFRALVAGDIPALAYVTGTSLTANQPVFGNGSSAIIVGTKRGNTTVAQMADNTTAPTTGHLAVFDANGNITDGGAPSGGGSVTSVGLSLPAEITVTGSPVTTSGTLTGAWATQSANKVFSGPTSGGAATPAFRSLVAADIPALSYADTSALYMIGATDATLTNARVWPGLYNNPDAPPTSPSAYDDEFDGTMAAWTWLNQGSSTDNISNSWVSLAVPSNAGGSVNVRGLYRTAPSPTYTFAAKMSFIGVLGNYIASGLMLRESSSSKLITFGPSYRGPQEIDVAYWNSATSFNSLPLSAYAQTFTPMYFRITNDNTNFIFQISREGVAWVTVATLGKNAFFAGAADGVGFGVYTENVSGAGACTLSLDWFRRTA
jgi:hypothetical protein